MIRLSLFAFVIVLGLGTAMFQNNRQPDLAGANDNISQNTDGAFRDGLFLGRLAAERGAESHIAVARWATAGDRASFTAGYRRGYGEVLTDRVAPASHVREAE